MEDIPILKIPAVPVSLQFEENEETFKIEAQMFVYDCFQRREVLLNDVVQITVPRERYNGSQSLNTYDEEDSDCVFKQVKTTNSLETKSFKSSAEFLKYISHRMKDSTLKSNNSRHDRRSNHKINYKDQTLASETNNNNENCLDGDCYIVNETEVENILQTVDKNIYLDQTIEIPVELKTTDYTLLAQVAENSTFINLHGEFENDVMMNFDNTFESENNNNENHYVIHSVMNGDVYMSKKNSNSSYYDKNIDVDSDESYTLFNLDGDQDFQPRNDGMKKADVRCERCGRKCRSLNALNHHMLVHSEARPFVCQICKKAFKEQPTLRRHMWTHMAKQHQCDICKKYFVEKSSLRRHMSTIHADFRPGTKTGHGGSKQQFCCSKCTKVFKSLTKFNMHAQMHGNPNYECEVCGKVYAGRSHLRIHQRIHTGEKPFQCTICGAKFAFKHVLKSHQARIHHRINKFKCNICSLVFLKKSDLSNHATCHMISMKKEKRSYNVHKNTKYNNNGEYKKQKSMLKSNISTNDPEYTLFGQLVDISNNEKDDDIKIEEFLKPNKKNNSQSDLRSGDKYFSSIITNEKKDKKCNKCYKEFERTGDLKRHIISHIVQDITTKAKEGNQSNPHYECSICGLSGFHQVDKFKAHLREHAKLTLYKCKYCERAFGDSSNYSKHKKVHGNKYLQCDMCRRKFNTKRMLISHMEYHKGHPPTRCGHCNKEFYFPSSFRKHIKISHQGKANVTYKCEYCGDRFKTVKEKWEHQWEQHEVRKVQADCDICGAKFRKLCLLRAHSLKQHGEANPSPTITIKEEPLDIFTNTEFLLCTEETDLI